MKKGPKALFARSKTLDAVNDRDVSIAPDSVCFSNPRHKHDFLFGAEDVRCNLCLDVLKVLLDSSWRQVADIDVENDDVVLR